MNALKGIPVVALPVPSTGSIIKVTDDPLSMYLNYIFTVPVNLSGLHVISIPSGLDKRGYPLGLQIIGQIS